jgi:CheY-like chemotaxis protein
LPDLVLCDLRMPVMTGEAFYTALESTRPELRRRVVFVTGDVVAPETARFLATAGRPVVEKPFTIAEISQIVTEVLASG